MPVANVPTPFLNSLYEFEIDLNKNIQKKLSFSENLLRHVDIYVEPQMMLDFWLPLLGALSHILMVRMIATVGTLNVAISIFKWIIPEYRPIWWLKELYSSHKLKSFNTDVNTCDTSAGFPSSHSVTFTAFAFILFHYIFTKYCRSIGKVEKNILIYVLITLPLSLVYSARLYFLTEFLHQCIAGSLVAIAGIHFINRYALHLLKLSKWLTSLFVVLFGLLPVFVYHGMLYMKEDPHWSVRMAFKWCSELTLMRHEAGPIFVLFRDYGYLLGVALSCPLLHNYRNNKASVYKRLPAILMLIFLNWTARQNTPKHLGRWIFLAYELARNCLQSYTLLSILPKILK